jgi:fructose-1,6-bisphosphatase/inositol monophosphatase family enzyme
LLFRALRDLWEHDPNGQPLLAVLCALAHDPVLRASAAVIVESAPGEVVTTSDFQAAIESKFPAAYKENTLRTTAQKVASSWDQAGHLHRQKRRSKVRTRVHPTSAATAYALMLGYLQGGRGQALFDTLWARVLDQAPSHLLDLAAAASQQGMLELRQAGGVIEVGFRQLLRPFDNHDQGRLL